MDLTSTSTQPSLLSHPRIVGAAPPRSRSTVYSSASAGRAFSRTDNNNGSGSGISCMDIDRGNDGTLAGSPSRYLLVGSGGGDCSISLYDLSYFGSDRYLYHHHPSQSSSSSNKSSRINSQYLHDGKSRIHTNEHDQSSITHRPIARSLRHNNDRTISEENASGVPSGHRQPLLGVNWYPGDVYGAFVSASISGEILVWDAKNFVPVFATYAHVYTGTGTGGTNSNEYKKSVAPLQCMDLPKTPESCPHGNALLALGLGGGARGVIQLCDAFRGGSATHELIGHGSGGGSGGGGGVNAVAWDPYHPFRLASGGDDCTVRLWDIRKAGARACLGVLDRENDMNIAYSNSGGNGGGGVDSGYYPSRKKQKARLVDSNNSGLSQIMYDGVESHGGPVTALAFAPGGDDLVSTGLDGRIHHWDLRPDSCYVSSVAAISSGNKRSSIEMIPGGGGMDPCVATGGRLMPTCFTGLGGGMNKLLPGSSSKSTSRRPSLSSRRTRRASLAVIQPGSRSTTTLLSTSNTGNSSKGQIVGHSLFGRRGKEPGGLPDFVLNGHLADVTCLVPIDGMWDNLKIGNCGDGDSTVANHVNFLTGGRDGMVLSWGSSRRRSRFASRREFDDEDARRHGSRPSYEWQNRFRCGNGTDYCHPESNQDEEQPFEDTDHW